MKTFGRELKLQRIKNLRSMKSKKHCTPNLKAKLWAIRLLDEIYGKESIVLPENRERNGLQCERESGASTRVTLIPSVVPGETLDGSSTRVTLSPKMEGLNISPKMDGLSTRATLSPKMDGLSTRATLSPKMEGEKEVLKKDGLSTRATLILTPEEDELYGPNSRATLIPSMQSSDKSEYTIVGNDVEALFPSLTDLESARIVREAIETSEMKLDNIDIVTALKYLRIVGGDDHLKAIGMGRIAPRWQGPRPDLLTVGGDAILEDGKWSKLKRELTEQEIRSVIARVVETAVIVCMSTHVYSFGPDLYLQRSGGPIGMRFTASLANVVMKQWDKMWVKLLKREGVRFDLFLRYVDDCRLFMPSLNPGWTWTGHGFEFVREQMKRDLNEGISFVQRTTREITKAMCQLTHFLKFTGEDSSMFADATLPTLDTSLWMKDGVVMHKFF